MPRPSLLGCALALVALAAGSVDAHSPPSEETLDRYLKITPMGDRVRLAYTVVFGQRPGAAVRRRLDRDRDGRISGAEAEVLGRELDGDVRGGLHLAVDGHDLAYQWARVDVGLGTETTAAGALSVDLVAWLCTGGGRAHALVVRDDVRLEAMGTTELTVERGPGIAVTAATLGGEPLQGDVASWTGVGGPIVTGLDLRYTSDDRATRPRDGRCTVDAAAQRRSRWPYLLAAAAAAAAVVVVVVVALRRRGRG